MPITLSDGLVLYSIPAVWVTALLPAIAKVNLIRKTIGWNNLQPRDNVRRLGEKAPALKDRAMRMEAAHNNGFEQLTLWIAAVFAGTYAGLDNKTLNIVSIAYITTRLLYNYVYINQSTKQSTMLRSLLFWVGTSLPFYVIISSANKIRTLSH